MLENYERRIDLRSRRIISLLLVLAMMLTFSSTLAFADGGTTIAAESVAAAANADTVQVPIKLTAADSGVATLNLAITVTGASFTMTNDNAKATFDSSLPGVGSTNVVDGTLYVAYAAIENVSAPATLVTVTLPAPAAGTQYTVNVAKGTANGSASISYFANNSFTEIEDVTFTGGTVSKEEAGDGFAGTLVEPVADYFATAGISTTFVDGASYAAGATFDVTCANPCLVAISTDEGTSWITLAAAKTEAANTYRFALPADLNGAFRIEMAVKGDIALDGVIKLSDVIKLAKYSDGSDSLENAFDKLRTDLVVNDKVDVSDVVILGKVASGSTVFSW